MEQAQTRVVLLIDGENSTPTLIDAFLAKAETLGEVIIRRVYGKYPPHKMLTMQMVGGLREK